LRLKQGASKPRPRWTLNLAELEGIYRRLLDYDVEIKTGRIEAAAALDAVVGALTTA
jgi:hypothetical protein